MGRTLLILLIALVVAAGIALYLRRGSKAIHVDPSARETIEKAKQR